MHLYSIHTYIPLLWLKGREKWNIRDSGKPNQMRERFNRLFNTHWSAEVVLMTFWYRSCAWQRLACVIGDVQMRIVKTTRFTVVNIYGACVVQDAFLLFEALLFIFVFYSPRFYVWHLMLYSLFNDSEFCGKKVWMEWKTRDADGAMLLTHVHHCHARV